MRLLEEQITLKRPTPSPEILVVGGGKGGVGKTCFSVNLAVAVAQKGWRVILVDADLSCSNVETVLGIDFDRRLDDFFYQQKRKNLRHILCETPYENLKVIPGTSGLLDVSNPRYQQKIALIRELRQLEADLVIVDLDAGAHLNTLDFFLIVQGNGILVITPEKTSIDNAFKFLRAALFRKISRFYQSPEINLLLKRNESLRDFIHVLQESDIFEDSQAIDDICGEMIAIAQSIKPKIVINRTVNSYEAQIACNILSKKARQELMIEPENLGYLLFDRCVPETVNSGRPFVLAHPKRKISQCIKDITNRLGFF